MTDFKKIFLSFSGYCLPAALCFVSRISAFTSSKNEILQGQELMVTAAALQFLGDSDRF